MLSCCCCGHSLATVTRGDDELRRVALSAPALKIILCQPFKTPHNNKTKKTESFFHFHTALESLDRDEENLAELAKNENKNINSNSEIAF